MPEALVVERVVKFGRFRLTGELHDGSWPKLNPLIASNLNHRIKSLS